jgi:transposase
MDSPKAISKGEGRGSCWPGHMRPLLTNPQWANSQPLVPPPSRSGCPRADDRRSLLCVLRIGCAWADLPAELGDDATAHRRPRRWQAAGAWERIRRALLAELDAASGIDWSAVLLDGGFTPANGGGIGVGVTGKGKRIRLMLTTDAAGVPLGLLTTVPAWPRSALRRPSWPRSGFPGLAAVPARGRTNSSPTGATTAARSGAACAPEASSPPSRRSGVPPPGSRRTVALCRRGRPPVARRAHLRVARARAPAAGSARATARHLPCFPRYRLCLRRPQGHPRPKRPSRCDPWQRPSPATVGAGRRPGSPPPPATAPPGRRSAHPAAAPPSDGRRGTGARRTPAAGARPPGW